MRIIIYCLVCIIIIVVYLYCLIVIIVANYSNESNEMVLFHDSDTISIAQALLNMQGVVATSL